MRKTGFIFGMAMALALMGAATVSEASEQTDNEEAVSAVSEREDIIASGVDGNLTWVIDADGKLTITGTGDYTIHETVEGKIVVPWSDYDEQIVSAEVNVTNMTDAAFMFYYCYNLVSVDLSGFDTSNVTDMKYMFQGCNSLASLDLSDFDTSNVVDMEGMFYECKKLTSLDLGAFDTSLVANMGYMFYGCWDLAALDVSSFDTSRVTNMGGMFYECFDLAVLDVSNFDTSRVTDMGYMFRDCDSLTALDVGSFVTDQVTNMRHMFGGCRGLAMLDVSEFDTSQVTNMNGVFVGCSGLTRLNVSSFDTSKVTDMGGMFCGCSNLVTLDVSNFDTSRVTYMNAIFEYCSGLTTLNVGNFDTSQVVVMDEMFSRCSSLETLDVSNFDTSQVESMQSMFMGCSSLKMLDLSTFNTSQVENMGFMFSECSSLIMLNLSSFDTSHVTSMISMFSDCSSLTSLDVSTFDTFQVKFMWDIFTRCDNLNTIKAFKVAPKKDFYNFSTCNLPGTYIDENSNKTTQITSDFAGKTLTKEGTTTPEPDQPTEQPSDNPAEQQVRNFVSRMYTVALGRDAEEAGLNDWTNRLLSHEIDGAGIANGFIMSEEFDNKKVSNETYVDILYRTFFDREADEGGRTDWLTKLANGNSRAFVLAGFVNSVEFDNLCNRYGIVRGEMQTNETAIGSGVRQFVERCYNKVLGREGEAAGIEDWTGRIARGEESPESVAKLFFFSEEYANKNTDNETFVETLYQTFMGRDSDPAGKADWVGRLSSGISREEVLEGFSRSEEFAEIVKFFGL